MRYSQQTPAFGNVSARLNVTPWVKRLLIANAVVYLITRAVGQDPVFDLFAFSPDRIWTRPWGILTYMFLHAGFWHLLMNMLFIFFFGPPLESRWGSAVFIKFYLICGLGGVLLSFAFSNSPIVGASAACYGMMLAFAMIWPTTNIYIWGILPVRAKWLVIFLVAVSFASAIGPSRDGVAHLAHLGGAVAGFLMMKSGLLPAFSTASAGARDWGPGATGTGMGRGMGAERGRTRGWPGTARRTGARSRSGRRRRWSVHSGSASASRKKSARKRADGPRKAELDKVDAVLDKISSRGIDSLTAEERDLLDRVSRQTRTN